MFQVMMYNLTLFGAPLATCVEAYWRWYTWIASRGTTILPQERAVLTDFLEAWERFGGIVDKGGVLFVEHRSLTYVFTCWNMPINASRWLDVIGLRTKVKSDTDEQEYEVELRRKTTVIRQIALFWSRENEWWFNESGERLPFEDSARLESERLENRFGVAEIRAFLRWMGGDFASRGTLADSREMRLLQHGDDAFHVQRGTYILSPEKRAEIMALPKEPED